MHIKDYSISLFDSLTEEQLLNFIKIFVGDSTLAESEIISNNPDRKRYNNLKNVTVT